MDMTPEKQKRIALGWGFAQAIIFPVAPEAFATYIAATKGPIPAFRVVGFLVLGMGAGAVVTYLLGWLAYEPMQAVYGFMPLAGDMMVADAHESLRVDDVFGIVFNIFGGVPSGIGTIHAASLGINILAYLFIYMFMSAARLLAATAIAIGLTALLAKNKDEFKKGKIAIGTWVAIYAGFLLTWML